MRTKKGTILSGVIVIVFALLFVTTGSVQAAPIDNFPVTVTQPDGTVLNIFASGDEYYNWQHDVQGYTILQDPASGYYVYADLRNGQLAPTKFVVGRVNPAAVGLSSHLNISPEQMDKIRQTFLDQTRQALGEPENAPHSGTINNLVVFIRFADEAEFVNATSTYTDMLNNSAAGANSLINYYREVSYNSLTVSSVLLPTPGATVVSYRDSQARGYYQPYNAATNPGGYTGGDHGDDRRIREHTLLMNAINYVNSLGQFPGGAAIDGDGDGYVDSLTFVVSGSPTGWSSLLWPHQWDLWTYPVTINGKTVAGYSFHLNSSLGTNVLAHEMFHVLGAPDLYHYSYDGFFPVGRWDLMEQSGNPPHHMGCYMKFKYGNWLGSIPEISSGVYTLNPLTSPLNNCYKIKSPNSTTEFFVVEYRNASSSLFESSLPGTGLLVYRINTLAAGNKNGPPDEVYLYRPGGSISTDGNVDLANFSSDVGRTTINDSTAPSSFLSTGGAGGLSISNVGASGATISFTLGSGLVPPVLTASDGTDTSGVNLSWTASSGATTYLVSRSDSLAGPKFPPNGYFTPGLIGADTWAAPGVTYYYWVRACDASSCSDFSAPETGWRAVPAAPAPPALTASDGTDTNGVNLSWTASSGATTYLVFRSDSLAGAKSPSGGYPTPGLGGADGWAAPGVTYYYWVMACNTSACSDFSAAETGWRGLTAPVLTASDGAYAGRVWVSWSASSGATFYMVYRSDSPGGVKLPTDGYPTSALGGFDNWSSPGVTYYYWVRACNASACSDFSAYDAGWGY